MNSKLLQWLDSHGMQTNGDLSYGVLCSFETNLIYRAFNNEAPVQIHFSCYTTDEQKRACAEQFANAKIKFFKYQFTAYGVNVILNDMTLNKLLQRLDEVVNTVCGILSQSGALGVGYCPVCGNTLDFLNAKKCNIDGFTISIDNNCVENINAVINEENKDFDEAPNNCLRGFAGALIGGLVGAAIAVVLNIVGFYAGISSFVAFALGTILYKKFGGKPNKLMVIIVSVTTFVTMLLSVVGIYVYVAVTAVAEVGYEMGIFEAFAYCLDIEDFAISLVLDLLMTLVFTIIGCVAEIRKLAKEIKRPKNI